MAENRNQDQNQDRSSNMGDQSQGGQGGSQSGMGSQGGSERGSGGLGGQKNEELNFTIKTLCPPRFQWKT